MVDNDRITVGIPFGRSGVKHVMRSKVLPVSALVGILAFPAQSQPRLTEPLRILVAEACTIAHSPQSSHSDVGGRVVVYRITVDKDGSVAALEVLERTAVARFVVLEGLEDCIRRWRFGDAGIHTLAVFGGTRGAPAIHVTRRQQSFRLMLPEQRYAR